MTHICSYLAGNASRLSDKTLTLCQGKAKTFRTVYSEVAALSQALRGAFKVTPGSRIGLIVKGTDDFLQASNDLAGFQEHVGRCGPACIVHDRSAMGSVNEQVAVLTSSRPEP